ncbi:MAG TPA: tyrosine--tRNA ligase [Porticoccaceae bacterium]|jgi:tyrosyl-tRNA synthetase|nr:tyrosine--tRNA ligase [Gammaproteobacteria bacterium]HIL60575.1 tyrosine--tRNA ligase [Porticoccaceae bacterium]
MSSENIDILNDLESRGLISQMAGGVDGVELRKHLAEGSKKLYCGFDPTAESLHIGSLVPLLALRRFQIAGHTPIALVGGATGLIGDPSFKSAERQLNSTDIISDWVDRIKPQLSQFLDFDKGRNAAQLVNNLDWTKDLDVLSFLRDVGKHFSVSTMVQKESVKQRLERSGEGISFTEFSYMILQSYDFAELNKRYSCTLQIGGSDQWGNITSGIDLTRRMNKKQVFGLTLPLVTKADGSKFGKTEDGTIWLDGKKTSPYGFYQFWLKAADEDVYKYLRYFSFKSPREILDIEDSDRISNHKPEAQSILAEEVTALVHGRNELQAAKKLSHKIFLNELLDFSSAEKAQLKLSGFPQQSYPGKPDAEAILVDLGMAPSRKAARQQLQSGAVTANGHVIAHQATSDGKIEFSYDIDEEGNSLFKSKRKAGLATIEE